MSVLRPRPRGRIVPSLQPAWQEAIEDYVNGIAWSPDDTLLAAAPITIFDAATGEVRATLAGHTLGTTAIAWQPGAASPVLASAGQDGAIRLWHGASGELLAKLDGGGQWVERIAWSSGGDLLASAAGRVLRLWNTGGEMVREWRDHPSTIADLGWQPGGRELAVAIYGGVIMRHADSGEVRRFEWKGSSLSLAWSPDARYIATGEQDQTVHFWDVATGKDLQMWGYETKALQLAWNHTGRYLATGGSPHIVIWDCSGRGPEGSKPQMLKLHKQPITALAYQPRGALLLSGGGDGRVAVWQPDKIKSQPLVAELRSPIAQTVWANTKRRVAAGTEDGAVVVFDVP
jgi:WD40 repeat protein